MKSTPVNNPPKQDAVADIIADHDRTNRDAALHYTNEHEVVTTGILYEVSRPTLVDEMLGIRWKAQGDAQPPERGEMLKVFAPAFEPISIESHCV